jgi:acyl-CoA thioesterase FadM
MSLLFRLIFNWIASLWRDRLGPADTLKVVRRVGVGDLDLNLHMNHARYLRVIEQTLLDGLQRSGVLGTMWHLKAVPVIGGAMIHYRRELRLWESYTVRLSYLGADAHWHVFRIGFVSRDGQVVAWGLVKGAATRLRRNAGSGPRLLGSEALRAAHVARWPGTPEWPELTSDAAAWLALERRCQPERGAPTVGTSLRAASDRR